MRCDSLLDKSYDSFPDELNMIPDRLKKLVGITSKFLYSNRTHLVEVGVGLRLSYTIEVIHIDELEVEEEARIGCSELWPAQHMGEVTKLLVAPVVKITQPITNK